MSMKAILLVLLMGLGAPVQYPRVVYNKCTKKYAVAVSSTLYFGPKMFYEHSHEPEWIIQADSVFYGKRLVYYYDYGFTELGWELQFNDSASAMKTYKAYTDERDMMNTKDLAAMREQDSTFKCQHTYQ